MTSGSLRPAARSASSLINGRTPLDLEALLRLRAVVARVGEMDLAKWWNTTGQLGPIGTAAVRRGLPRTHYFAQARSVFAVAAHRCDEWFNPPSSATLWRLPEGIEEQFQARWEHWLDNATAWKPFFEEVEGIGPTTWPRRCAHSTWSARQRSMRFGDFKSARPGEPFSFRARSPGPRTTSRCSRLGSRVELSGR